jgi:endonuclease-3
VETRKKRLIQILGRLEKSIPEAQTALAHQTPFQLLVATILSAQCTDARVNQVTPALFKVYETAEDFAGADGNRLEKLILSTGFYKSKAKSIMGAAQKIMETFYGEVPQSIEALITLPGVGRKTANVILGAFGKPAIVVDTHVRRVANRLQLTQSGNPDQIEMDLGEVMPKSKWTSGSSRLLLHGRHVCRARAPLCRSCALFDLCPADEEKRKAENRL